MTTRDTFERDLSLWLREEGEHRVPDHLAEVRAVRRDPPAPAVVEPRKVSSPCKRRLVLHPFPCRPGCC